jgi:hypothetical protein
MKKSLAAVMVLAGSLALSHAALADKGAIEGTLVKLEADVVVIKTEKGEEKSWVVTEKTKKRGGEMPVGSMVEVYPSKDGKSAAMLELIKK